MQVAIAEAEHAAAIDEVPVGAVLTCNNKIIAKAYNRTNNNPLDHAEIIILNYSIKKLQRKRLTNCDLYVTLEPCPMCAYAISITKISNLYFAAEDKKSGGVINGARVLYNESCHHRPNIYNDISADISASILKKFFKDKR